MKKKAKKESGEATYASVKKEMAKPRELRLEAYLPFKPEFATHLYLHEFLPSRELTACDLRDRLGYYFRSISC
jgi:hypothetical protein